MGLEKLSGGLQDYATDRRGDVGSWVREVAIEVTIALLEQRLEPRVRDRNVVNFKRFPVFSCVFNGFSRVFNGFWGRRSPPRQRFGGYPQLKPSETTKLMGLVLQQAVEKIDRLREPPETKIQVESS